LPRFNNKMKIRVAQIKVQPIKGNLEANHLALMKTLGDLPSEGIDVVVTPECFLDGYIVTEEHVTAAEVANYAIDPANSPYANEIREWARNRGTWFVYGCLRLKNGGVCNSALIYNRAGDLVGHYDKLHLQRYDQKVLPGRALPVFDSDFGKFGVMICADRRWPETVRTLALRGARVIFNPTYGMYGDFNAMIVRIRSYESEVFICFTHPSEALITSPKGEILVQETSESRSWTVTELNLDDVDEARAALLAHLRDRRPDMYER
jgi:omega-amidase